MKAKVFILVTLVFAGLTFWSCTKDNSLMDETTLQQTETLKTEQNPHIGGLHMDIISNVPDPFEDYTTISYIVRKEGFVSLFVYKKGDNFGINLIGNKFQRPGKYTVTLDASGLEHGKYIAVLSIKTDLYSVVYKEEMTKAAKWHQDDESSATD